MKNIALLISFVLTLTACHQKKKEFDVKDYFDKSFKEKKDDNLLSKNSEHFDSITKIYSNYKYRVSFDAPNHWSSDAGVSKHTIFRTFQSDSAITFAINVIELKMALNKEATNIWDLYAVQKEKMDYQFKALIEKQFNSKVEDFKASKTFLKNRIMLKRKFKHLVRELDLEYYNTSIVYQTIIGRLNYTFSLDVPTIFYDENPYYYNNLIRNVSFLYNEDFRYFLNNYPKDK